jgi:NAD(P)H-hydrate epimerase
VVVCCGKGNNGGDGYVIARHLELAGCEVQILAAFGVEALSGDARTHAEVARRGGIPISVCHDACDRATLDDWLHDSDWIVDALLGTGTVGSVREPHTSLIEAINRSPAHVLAVDLPSGLDCDSGEPLGPCVQAEVTATFVAWKSGFTRPSAAEYVGEVHVIDIGVPHKLLLELSRGSHWEPRN